MSKRKFEFESNDWDDAREYKKSSKKKTKHRENSNKSWRQQNMGSFDNDDYQDDDYDYGRRADSW